MADINIDEGKAMDWVVEVQNEIKSVEQTLKEVEKVCTEFPGDGDVIMQMIEKTGKLLEDAWTTANSAFKNAWKALEEGLSTLKSAGSKIQETFEDLNTKI